MTASTSNKYVPQPTGPTNPSLDQIVLQLWNTGKYTYSTLAKEILLKHQTKFTRSAIGGKLNRAEARGLYVWRPGGPKNIIAGRNGTNTEAPKRRYRSQAERKAAVPKKAKAPKEPKEPKEPKATVKAEVRKPKPIIRESHDDPKYAGPFTLAEVSAANSCRYPIGERPNLMFCGRKRAPHSEAYCGEHHEKCHSKHFYSPEDRRIPASLR